MIKTFYIFSFFLGQSRSLSSVSKKQILEICFQFASLMAFSVFGVGIFFWLRLFLVFAYLYLSVNYGQFGP